MALPPIWENVIVSLMTGIVSAGSVLQTLPANGERDWAGAAVVGVVGFAGAMINGLRQLHRTPPDPDK